MPLIVYVCTVLYLGWLVASWIWTALGQVGCASMSHPIREDGMCDQKLGHVVCDSQS